VSQVCIDRGVTNGADKIETCGEGNMVSGYGIAKPLSQPEIDEINLLIFSNHEIFGFDIAMNVMSSMKGL